MKKADIILAILTGLVLAWFVASLIGASGIKEVLGIKVDILTWILIISLPISALFGLWICYLIGKKFPFVFQLGKFLLIGALATLFDLSILNFLIGLFSVATGWAFSVFKGTSFVIATIVKYWANKFLAFEKKEMTGAGKEFTQFFVITLVGFGINVGVASFVVNVFGTHLGLNPQIWANIGGIIAALVGFMWSFLGYKFIVFKK